MGESPEGVFEVHAAGAPGQPTEQDIRTDGDARPQLQRLCTQARQRWRRQVLDGDFSGVPAADPARMAWRHRSVGTPFVTLPQPDTSPTSDEFTSAVCIYLGMAILVIVREIARRAPHGQLTFRDKQTTRILDVFGHSLSAFMGKGNGRTRLHNALETEIVYIAKTAKLDAEHQPFLSSRMRSQMAPRGSALRRHKKPAREAVTGASFRTYSSGICLGKADHLSLSSPWRSRLRASVTNTPTKATGVRSTH